MSANWGNFAFLVCENKRRKKNFSSLENRLQGRNYWSHHLIKFHAINKPYLERKRQSVDHRRWRDHQSMPLTVWKCLRLLWHHFDVLNPLSRVAACSWKTASFNLHTVLCVQKRSATMNVSDVKHIISSTLEAPWKAIRSHTRRWCKNRFRHELRIFDSIHHVISYISEAFFGSGGDLGVK